jgi:hypothetical protein
VTQATVDDVRLLTRPLAGGPELPAGLLKIAAAEMAPDDRSKVAAEPEPQENEFSRFAWPA